MNILPKLAGFNVVRENKQTGGQRVKITGKRSLEIPGFSSLQIEKKQKKDEEDDAIEFIEKELRQDKFYL